MVEHYNNRKAWRAFRIVLEHYNELKETLGSCPAIDYGQSGGKTGYVMGKVIITSSDFMADVMITAKRVLTPDELSFFKRTFAVRNDPTTITPISVSVQEKMGAAFMTNGIYPVRQYMRSVRVK